MDIHHSATQPSALLTTISKLTRALIGHASSPSTSSEQPPRNDHRSSRQHFYTPIPPPHHLFIIAILHFAPFTVACDHSSILFPPFNPLLVNIPTPSTASDILYLRSATTQHCAQYSISYSHWSERRRSFGPELGQLPFSSPQDCRHHRLATSADPIHHPPSS